MSPSGAHFCVIIHIRARVVELVDTHALGACANRLAGSTPVAGTIFVRNNFFML